jgi:SOS-response transcriptional repressor LexA
MTTRRKLTIGQATLITTIRNFQHLHGHAPTVRELAALTDRARGTVFQRITALERHGLLRRHPRKHRAIEILPIAV